MSRRFIHFMLLGMLLIGMVAMPGSSLAAAVNPSQVPDTRPPFESMYFPQTQHNAVNSFYELWKNTPNSLFVYGYPISQPFIEESFTNPGEYYRVQYYERAVLEEHPENYGTPFYILGRLMGNQLIKDRLNEAPFQAVADPNDGTFDSVTNHTLRNDHAPFRTFWLQN